MGKARVWVLRPAGWNMTSLGSGLSALTQWASEQPAKSVPAFLARTCFLAPKSRSPKDGAQ